MDINGKDGPTLKKIFTCDGCRYLSKTFHGIIGKYPYKCYHYDIIKNDTTSIQLLIGNIDDNLITPDNCPFLLKKTRFEKLNELEKIN